jgi:lipopolysaccharide/colanic/teichoic acid biosynthesis glycosyltransferase
MPSQKPEVEPVSVVKSQLLSETTTLPLARARRGIEIVFKRFIDILGSGTLLILFSPLLLLLALLVALVDGMPIVHRRRVIALKSEFDAYKLRTMVKNADAILATDASLRSSFNGQFKLKSDPRVTRLGGWLRKYSLDELPQLINVFKGQMSLVGPRMITAPELEKYGEYKALILTVKPGLTGYWQVRGRQDVSYAERVRMDVYYICNWSLLLDVMILLQTPAKVIFGQGAY